MKNRNNFLFFIFFIVILCNIPSSFASLYPFESSVIPITWNTVTNAVALDTDQDGFIDTAYSASSLSVINPTFTKIFGTGLSAISPSLSGPTTLTGITIGVFDHQHISVSSQGINAGCTVRFQLVNIYTGVVQTPVTGTTGTISGSNCLMGNTAMKQSDGKIATFSYSSPVGDGTCHFKIFANATLLTSTTTSGSYCAGAGLSQSAIVNWFGVDPSWNTNVYLYDVTTKANSVLTSNTGYVYNDTSTSRIQQLNLGTGVSTAFDINATHWFNGIKNENYKGNFLQKSSPTWNNFFGSEISTTVDSAEKIFYLHYKMLKSDLTVEPTKIKIKISGQDYIGYLDPTSKSLFYASIPDLTNYAFQSYLADSYTPQILTNIASTVLPTQSATITTPLSSHNVNVLGIVGVVSGYSISPQSTDRILNPEFENSLDILPVSIGPTTGNTAVSVLIKNLSNDAIVKIENPSFSGFGHNVRWGDKEPTADNTFTIDLPTNHCFTVFVSDGSLIVPSWESLGQLCASGTMPKTITYSSNLSFTFWSLPYGVSHTFAQETETLQTKVRHDIFPFNYTIKIFDSSDVLAYTQEFNSTNEIDIQSINASGISRPALVKVFDIDNNQLYYATIGTPSYFSDSVAWFEEWLSIEGFNLLFMLPIVFSAMFTRNTVGIGTTITVVFIATLTWIGILPIPDNVIYFMIAIGIVGMIAHKKLYD